VSTNGNNKISLPVINRLPRYYRTVRKMQHNGVTTVSSSELAGMLGTTASQVRQDFNCFGGFGQQGVGYNVDLLSTELESLLMGGDALSTIVIGTGRLGRAISHFLAFDARGFRLIAAFDQHPDEVGSSFGILTVRNINTLGDYCRRYHPQIAVLCIPEEGAAQLAPTLMDLGIRGFWNFSNYDLPSREGVTIVSVHLGDSLTSLGFRVRESLENNP